MSARREGHWCSADFQPAFVRSSDFSPYAVFSLKLVKPRFIGLRALRLFEKPFACSPPERADINAGRMPALIFSSADSPLQTKIPPVMLQIFLDIPGAERVDSCRKHEIQRKPGPLSID
jgi:hypothetical protein